jgi:S-adenosylmethionine:tRNA ribosyltransferase-isomerase
MLTENDLFISLSDYDYPLPPERIAEVPLPRGAAKQLRYAAGRIEHGQFAALPQHLHAGHQLFFNNTKVLPARMHFHKGTGGLVEIFLLSPEAPSKDVAAAMLAQGEAVWQCAIGNLKRWKDGQPLQAATADGKVQATAWLEDRQAGRVRLEWMPADMPFVDVVEALGKTPLPPYIRREAEEADKERYQTVYSKAAGAVAAPTAGLHFSEEILLELAGKGIEMHELTLHVGAGTFQPVKTENALAHPMHGEQVLVRRAEVEALCRPKAVVAVGTTSMRTLESLYWYGVALLERKGGGAVPFFVEKLAPYQRPEEALPGKAACMEAVLRYMDEQGLDALQGATEIYLFPSYRFRICEGLVTNFHMPKSTLLLLIAAFIGPDWRRVYQEALDGGYRFLSYGDSSLLFTHQTVRP